MSVFQFARKSDAPTQPSSPPSNAGSGAPPPRQSLPKIEAPDLELALIGGMAAAVHQGKISLEDARDEVKKQHGEKFKGVLSTLSEAPAGQKSTKEQELGTVRSDLAVVDAAIGKSTQGDEVSTAAPSSRTMAQQIDLILTIFGAVLLWGSSLWTNQSIIESSAIGFGVSAWCTALLPLGGAFVLKGVLHYIEEQHRAKTMLTFAGLGVLGAILFLLTLSHQAGGAAAGAAAGALADLSAAAPEPANTRALIRGTGQLLAEIFGGGFLFIRVYEILRGDGQTKMVYRIRDKWTYETTERKRLREAEQHLKEQLAEIDKWFESHEPLTEAYQAKAVGLLLNNLSLLKGGAA